MNAALTGIKQDNISLLYGPCSLGHLVSIINNTEMEML